MWIHNTSPPISIGRQFLLDAAPYSSHYVLPFLIYYYDPPLLLLRSTSNSYWTPVSIGRSPLFFSLRSFTITFHLQFLLGASFYWTPIPIGHQFLLDAAPYFLITFFYYYVSPPIPIGRQFLLDANFYWTQPPIFVITIAILHNV